MNREKAARPSRRAGRAEVLAGEHVDSIARRAERGGRVMGFAPAAMWALAIWSCGAAPALLAGIQAVMWG